MTVDKGATTRVYQHGMGPRQRKTAGIH
jgi:hypothetical protein